MRSQGDIYYCDMDICRVELGAARGNRCCYHRRMNERQWRMRPSASSSGRRRAAREEEDAHLWASDATLFARTIEAGPDLYASDAALFSGDARNHGADLWASDAALFATSEDRARARADLRRWLVARASSADRDRARSNPSAPARCVSGRWALSTPSEVPPPKTSETRAVGRVVCGHAYHLRCMLAVLDARSGTPLCPTCRRPVRRERE